MNREKHNRRIIHLLFCIAISSMLAASPFNVVTTAGSEGNPDGQVSFRVDPIDTSQAHTPILITNDAELVAFQDKTGNGTSDHPYVIRDFHVEASGGFGIWVISTSLYLTFFNVTVTGITDPGLGGICLQHCANIAVINCTVLGALRGIRAEDASNIRMTGNHASENMDGYYLISLTSCTVTGNDASRNANNGFYVGATYNCNISWNRAHDNDCHGFRVGSNVDLTENDASGNGQNGFELYYTEHATVARNHAWDNAGYNIHLYQSSNNTISGNVFSTSVGLHTVFISGTSSDNNITGNGFYGLVETQGVGGNAWDNGSAGNFWSTYLWFVYGATNDGHVWDAQYPVFGAADFDRYPLVYAPGTTDITPVAGFTANATTIATGGQVGFSFTGEGGNSPTHFRWSFGDTTPNATVASPVHQYTSPGYYTVELTIFDSSGDTSSQTRTEYIRVVDNIAPVVSQPGDVTYNAGNTGNAISWEVVDTTTASTRYTLYRNGVQVATGTWTHGVSITVSIDGLAAGTYNFTITVDDGIGAIDQDTVMVTVNENTTVGTDALVFIFAAACIGVLAIVRRKKGFFNGR